MEYSVGQPGRVIVVKLSEGEDLYKSIESLCEKENIKCGSVFITGGIRKAEVVVGPKREKPALEANFKHFEGPGEAMGVGTIYPDDEGKAKMHIHTGMGRGDNMIVGCPRGGAEVFLILEVTIIEITGVNAAREIDESCGLKLLKIK
jgi:hypothetical protein